MKKLIIYLFLILTFVSCQKDDFDNTTSLETIEQLEYDELFKENFGNAKESNFIGRVLNQDGIPLKDVEININNIAGLIK